MRRPGRGMPPGKELRKGCGRQGDEGNHHQDRRPADFLNNVTFVFDKLPKDFESGAAYRKARAEYFKKAFSSLREKFYDKVNALVKEMNAALPQEVKDNNKKA